MLQQAYCTTAVQKVIATNNDPTSTHTRLNLNPKALPSQYEALGKLSFSIKNVNTGHNFELILKPRRLEDLLRSRQEKATRTQSRSKRGNNFQPCPNRSKLFRGSPTSRLESCKSFEITPPESHSNTSSSNYILLRLHKDHHHRGGLTLYRCPKLAVSLFVSLPF